MSGIYIPSMEMPNKKNGAVLIIYPDGKCAFEDGKTYQAVPVPPHGDLIDRYDLKNKEITIDYDEWDDIFDDGLLFVTDLIDNAPAIIPASEEGAKTEETTC